MSRRQLQRELQKSNRFNLPGTFFLPSLHDYNVELPNKRFA